MGAFFTPKVKIIIDNDDLDMTLGITHQRGPGSAWYDREHAKDSAVQELVGREYGTIIRKRFRGVDHVVEYGKDGWLLDGSTIFPSLRTVKDHLIDPKEEGKYKRQKRLTPEMFFKLLPRPKKASVK